MSALTHPPPAAETRRQPALDGLRGLAALTVVLTHFLAAFWPSVLHGNYPGSFGPPAAPSAWLAWMQLPLLNIGYNGAFAVAVFFVLSGHVLAQGAAGTAGRRVFLRRFFVRWPRLGLPVAAAVLLTYAVFRLGAMQHQAAGFLPAYGAGLGWPEAWAEALVGVLWLGWSQIDPPSWSLHWEFLGSLALLCALALLGSYARAWRVALLLLALGAWALWGADSTYLLALFFGAWRARAPHARTQWRWLALAVAVYLGGFQYGYAGYGWSALLAADAGLQWRLMEWCQLLGALLLVDAVRRGALEGWLTTRPMQWLGRISFGLYLVHFVVLMSLGLWLGFALNSGGTLGRVWLALAAYVAASLLLAVVFERWVDRPAVAVSQALARRLVARIERQQASALLFFDYQLVLPLLARLPTPLAYRAAAWRSRWHCWGRRDWAELTVGQPYVHERATRVCAQLQTQGYPVSASGVQQRYDTVGREELDAYRLERYGWRCFDTHTEALQQQLQGRTPGRGLVVLTGHFDKSLVGVAGLGLLGLKTYAAASNLTEDLRINTAIRRYFQRKYAAANALMGGAGFVYIETGLRRLLKALRAGDVVCVFADAPASAQDESGIWVPWLGQERRMQELALRLARETDSDLLGLVCSHGADGSATWHCTAVLPAAGDVRDHYLQAMAFLESWVQRQPGRWWALHQLGDYPTRASNAPETQYREGS